MIYDELIEKDEKKSDDGRAARALLDKAWILSDGQEKIAVYDRVIEKYGDKLAGDVCRHVADELHVNALCVPDDAQKIALYDRVVDTYGKETDFMFKFIIDRAKKEKERLMKK